MAPIIADNLIESGCEFVDNSETTVTASAQTSETITFYSETSSSSSNLTFSHEAETVIEEEEEEVEKEESVNELKNFNKNVENECESSENFETFVPKKQMPWEGPGKQGLYDPQNEHEACGVGFIVAIDGKRSHKVSLFQFFLR